MKIDKSTPLWDTTRTVEERIDWLLSAMSMDEKLSWLGSTVPDLERLGIPGSGVGGEAAHGVEGRNDQMQVSASDVTTSFPQPIGMSASFDVELIKKAGEVTGTEARVVSHRHPGRGLSRWAPTVDLERDPRWGRNEEGYGEDPVLTGAMAGAYIKGMQGEHPTYIRTAATLKHFYGNNTEAGRGFKNSSIDPRNQYELYLEPFRRCIEDGGAEGVMTAYNKINGTPGILNAEVTDILKNRYGLTHVVGDGGALGLVTTLHHYYGMHTEALAGALKAGVDGMSDAPELVEKAAREAYELGLITQEDADKAIRNIMRTKLRLGLYDRDPVNPFDRVTEADLDSAYNREICMQLSREAVVLLKNEEHILPLDASMDPAEMALIGPLADAWYQDWYGGTAPYRKTLRQGLDELGIAGMPYEDALDRVQFLYKGKGLAVDEKGGLYLAENPDTFIKEYWGEGSYTLRCERTGNYLKLLPEDAPVDPAVKGQIEATAVEPFDWFVLEIFHMQENEKGEVMLSDRFHYPIRITESGTVLSVDAKEGTPLQMIVTQTGIEKAVELARGKRTVILAVGCNSMINAKEEIDRKTLTLPDDQRTLIREIARVNKRIILVLFANYPYDLTQEQELVQAIVLSATGSQDMGSAMAEAVFGKFSPAGRLNMTWYQGIEQLPDIDDYDIIKGKRTYRYFDGPVLYPFGYGMTYSSFRYENFQISLQDQHLLQAELVLENTGNFISDEVVQIYGQAPASRVQKPLRQLLGFTRVKGLQPGEKRKVAITIPIEELRFYDVISRSLMVEAGIYNFFAGASSQDQAVSARVSIPGSQIGVRDITKRTAADHYDAYENLYLTEGRLGYRALSIGEKAYGGMASYRDCGLRRENTVISLYLKSQSGVKIRVFINDKKAGCWEGDTRTCEQKSAPQMDRYAWMEAEERNRQRKPVFEDIDIPLQGVEPGIADIRIELEGEVQFCYWKMKEAANSGSINLGVAN